MWYERIVNAISDIHTDVLFVIDPVNMLDYPDIQSSLGGIYDVVSYQNELVLRRVLRNLDHKTIIKFREDSQIPYDLYSSRPTLNINPIKVFPLLNSDVLSKVPLDQYQRIFKKYEEDKDGIFDKLSVKDTENFLDSILYFESIGKKEKALELIEKLTELLSQQHLQQNWGNIARYYGELKYLMDLENLDLDISHIESLIQSCFKEFVSDQYEDLVFDNQSPLNSNILNLIFNYTPTALICFDCMGFGEWNVIKNYLNEKLNLNFCENYSFSMLPSDTSFSRTALFSGLLPVQIDELNMKNKTEEKLFKECLKQNFKISESDIYFQRCSGPDEIREDYAFEDYQAIGIIFSFIDEFVHGKNMNKSLIISLLEKYLEQTQLEKLIKSLLDKGFSLYFSSDHGNLLAKGNGIRPPRDLFESRSRRYLKSAHQNILAEYVTPQSLLIQLKEIIGKEYLLLLVDNSMFNTKGKTGLTHGGISLEEVVIPFIEVKKE